MMPGTAKAVHRDRPAILQDAIRLPAVTQNRLQRGQAKAGFYAATDAIVDRFKLREVPKHCIDDCRRKPGHRARPVMSGIPFACVAESSEENFATNSRP